MCNKRIAIIGGGASGVFCAINIKINNPNCDVDIWESGNSLMHKLSLTGGGRCNITNNFSQLNDLRLIYPRGFSLLKKLFNVFSPDDTVKWFENHGIKLRLETNGRMFPVSNSAVDVCIKLQSLLNKYKINFHCNSRVNSIEKDELNNYVLSIGDEAKLLKYNAVVVSTGGYKANQLDLSIEKLGVEYIKGAPSLFSLKIKNKELNSLMGVLVENAFVSIIGSKFKTSGALLITHFGLSGPAILKLSSFAAQFLSEKNHKCEILINWCGLNEEIVRENLSTLISSHNNQKVTSAHLSGLTSRFWEYILVRAEINLERKFAELGKKNLNKLVSVLTADSYIVNGRGQYGEEFVTCGGVSLQSVNKSTLESINNSGLYFTGEYLDVDAITGGFNLQNCWTTGFVVAKYISQ